MFSLFDINFSIFKELKIKLGKKKTKGGDAGEVYIAARRIVGSGKISAEGGNGDIGGKGGKITLITEENNFEGEISAKGGQPIK